MPNEAKTSDAGIERDTAIAKSTSRGGRPSALTLRSVGEAIEEIEKRDGTTPSVRKLQEEIGGGRSRLSELRERVLAERLVASATPGDGATAKTLAKAGAAALTVLATEALRSVDRSIENARLEAAERIAAAERVRIQAERSVEAAALERERALGQVSVLERSAETARVERDELRTALAGIEARGRESRATIAGLRLDLSASAAALSRAEEDRDALDARLEGTTSALERERAARVVAEREVEEVVRERDAAIAAREATVVSTRIELDDVVGRLDAESAARSHAESERSELERDRDDLRLQLSQVSGELGRLRDEMSLIVVDKKAQSVELDRERARQDERDRLTATALAAQQKAMAELLGRLDGTGEAPAAVAAEPGS